ncbi:hypothetical protein Syun_018137 [Stephania yunnanensis]|uniref:Uncharacterized protein n=1 Tax=Stephania yunnanensis TaxID=152371 RepID=A0AAP0NWR5_9MAGN
MFILIFVHVTCIMYSMFKECPHPDDKQRMKLSQELGLKPRQVKFWFQNRRTQMKAQQDRSDNVILRSENESLKNDNFRLQAALRNIVCPNCGGSAILGEICFDEQHLRLENARLKEELDRISSITSRYSDGPIHALVPASPLLLPSLDLDMGIYARNFQETLGSTCNVMNPISAVISENPNSIHGSGIVIMEHEKTLALEFAMSATDELVRMCHAREPLWIQSSSNVNGVTKEELNFDEHARLFPWAMKMKLHHHHQCDELRTEATRDTAVVIMNGITLADAFLDANKWMELFPSIVARARTIQVVTTGVSGHASGSLHLMYAELQALTPLVPTRETYFLRYFQQNVEEGTWAIVDFPVDGFHESHNLQLSSPRYYRRPSGCVIQDMPNGYSRVTWVEHGEVEVKPVHRIFNDFVNTGMAFGAQRWLAVLQQQCERLASLMARNISDLGVIPSPEARKNMMKLAQRMIKTFCYNISTSGGQSWTTLSDSSDDNVRITTRRNTEPGQPSGLILCAVSTTWLPFSQHQLDFLSSGASSQEVAHIANGSHPGNCISLLRINAASNSSQNVELMLQESNWAEQAGSMVVYTTIDVDSVQLAMNGEDPSFVPILPLGFIITPSPPNPTTPINTTTNNNNNNTHHIHGSTTTKPTSTNNSSNSSSSSSSCLLTVGLQVLASAIPAAKINLSSVTAINSHICNVVHQINVALNSSINVAAAATTTSISGGGGGGGGDGGSLIEPFVSVVAGLDR